MIKKLPVSVVDSLVDSLVDSEVLDSLLDSDELEEISVDVLDDSSLVLSEEPIELDDPLSVLESVDFSLPDSVDAELSVESELAD